MNYADNWLKALSLLREMANQERVGFQILGLGTKDDHHEELLAEILPEGVDEYDPDNGLYADGKED